MSMCLGFRRMRAVWRHVKPITKNGANKTDAKINSGGKLTVERVRPDAGEWPFLKSKSRPWRDAARHLPSLDARFQPYGFS